MAQIDAFDFDGLYNDDLGMLLEAGSVSVEDLEYELEYRAANDGDSSSDLLSGYSADEIRYGIDWIADNLG